MFDGETRTGREINKTKRKVRAIAEETEKPVDGRN